MVVHGVDIDALSTDEKQDVLAALVESIDAETEFELSPEQEEELKRRSKLLREGKLKLLDLEEVLQSI